MDRRRRRDGRVAHSSSSVVAGGSSSRAHRLDARPRRRPRRRSRRARRRRRPPGGRRAAAGSRRARGRRPPARAPPPSRARRARPAWSASSRRTVAAAARQRRARRSSTARAGRRRQPLRVRTRATPTPPRAAPPDGVGADGLASRAAKTSVTPRSARYATTGARCDGCCSGRALVERGVWNPAAGGQKQKHDRVGRLQQFSHLQLGRVELVRRRARHLVPDGALLVGGRRPSTRCSCSCLLRVLAGDARGAVRARDPARGGGEDGARALGWGGEEQDPVCVRGGQARWRPWWPSRRTSRRTQGGNKDTLSLIMFEAELEFTESALMRVRRRGSAARSETRCRRQRMRDALRAQRRRRRRARRPSRRRRRARRAADRRRDGRQLTTATRAANAARGVCDEPVRGSADGFRGGSRGAGTALTTRASNAQRIAAGPSRCRRAGPLGSIRARRRAGARFPTRWMLGRRPRRARLGRVRGRRRRGRRRRRCSRRQKRNDALAQDDARRERR